MFTGFFVFLVLVALVSGFGEIIMRVRLTRLAPRSEKLPWWGRGGDQIAATYQQVFPRSKLPAIRTYAFWFFIAVVALLLCLMLIKRHTP